MPKIWCHGSLILSFRVIEWYFRSKKEYFFHGWDDMIKQLINIKRKFQTYTKFDWLPSTRCLVKKKWLVRWSWKEWFYLPFIRNEGKGQFTITQLSMKHKWLLCIVYCQWTWTGDNYLDLMVCGNDYGLELSQEELSCQGPRFDEWSRSIVSTDVFTNSDILSRVKVERSEQSMSIK